MQVVEVRNLLLVLNMKRSKQLIMVLETLLILQKQGLFPPGREELELKPLYQVKMDAKVFQRAL
jgi:hypothetical protein